MEKTLTTEELAAVLRTKVHTVRYWRQIGYGPRGKRIGRRVLYREVDVQAFLDEQFAEDGPGEGAA